MSELDIINEALILLGAEPLASLSDGTAQALSASNIYRSVRREALAEHPWNFAVRESQLPRLVQEEQNLHSTEFDHAYQLPTGLVRVIGLISHERFAVYGARLYTQDSGPRLVYVADTPPGAWSPHFVRLVVFELAASFAISLTEQVDRAQHFASLAMSMRIRARSVDAQQGSPQVFNLWRLYLRGGFNPLAGA